MHAQKMTEQDVLQLIAKLGPLMPDDATIKDMMPEFIRIVAAISGRIPLNEASALIAAIAVVARACAANDPVTTCKVAIIQSETLQ